MTIMRKRDFLPSDFADELGIISQADYEAAKALLNSGDAEQRLDARRVVAAYLKEEKRSALRASAELTPLDWRARHDPLDEGAMVVERGGQMPDVNGDIGNPFRTIDTVGRLHRRNEIRDRDEAAARRFQAYFDIAKLDPLRCPDLDRTIGGSGEVHLTEAMAEARDEVHAVLTGLGGLESRLGSVAWHIIGSDMSIKDYAVQAQWTDGRSINAQTVKGFVVSACEALAKRYGT